MAVFLKISINTVQKWIAKALTLNPMSRFTENGEYDIDEMQTCVGKRSRKIWVAYGWNVGLRLPLGLNIGGRSAVDLSSIVDLVLTTNPQRINTDNHAAYPLLIPGKLHRKGKRKANHIEREHRNMRKDIPFLVRETMCYAKTMKMLEARIRWYFWGDTDPYFFLRKPTVFLHKSVK
jgi:IS1 family transposase